MFRINKMDNTELSISLFDKANQKHKGCAHSVQFNGQRSCKLFHHILDNSTDVAQYCGSCPAVTKSPTTQKLGTRN
jgi:hypothetical protein